VLSKLAAVIAHITAI